MVNSLSGINLNNPFEKKLDKIIEYFIEFYGEEYRQRITNRLKNAIYIFVDDITNNRVKLAKEYFIQRENILLTEFAQDALKALNIERDSIQLTYNLISNLQSWSNEIKEEDYASIYMLLKALDGKEIPDNSFKNMEKAFKNGYFLDKNQIHSTIKLLAQLYTEKYEPQFLSLWKEKNSVLTPAIEYKKIFEEKKKIYDEHSLVALRKHLQSYFNLDVDEYLFAIRKWILNGPTSLTKYEIQKINKFENLVFQQNKMSFKQFKKVVFSNNIDKKLKEIEESLNNELSFFLNGYSDNLSKIYNSNILFEKEILLSISQFVNYNNCAGYIFPTINFENKGQTTNVCVLNTFFSLIDSCAIHELNHIVESTNFLDSGVFYSKTGFFRSTEKLYQNQQLSKYNEINEIFNEYISLKIYELMRRDNFQIGNIGYKKTTYSYAFPAFENIIEENLHDIITSRMSDDPNAFAKKIGKENFDNLAIVAYNLLHLTSKNNFALTMKEIEKEINQKAPNTDLTKIDLDGDWSELTLRYLQNIRFAEKIRKDIKKAITKKKTTQNTTKTSKKLVKGDYHV